MIIQSFPSLRPKPPVPVVTYGRPHTYPNAPRLPEFRDKMLSDKLGIPQYEVVRRDNVVRNMWLTQPFHINQVVYPRLHDDFLKYGRLIIRDIYKSYHDFNDSEQKKWPVKDDPFILTLARENHELIVCNHEFLTSTFPHGSTK